MQDARAHVRLRVRRSLKTALARIPPCPEFNRDVWIGVAADGRTDECIGGLETHYKCKITRSPFIHESVAVVTGLESSPLVRRSPRPRFVFHLERFLPLSLSPLERLSGSVLPSVPPSAAAAAAESQVFSHLQKSCEPGAEVQFRMKQRRREIKGNIHLISIRLS